VSDAVEKIVEEQFEQEFPDGPAPENCRCHIKPHGYICERCAKSLQRRTALAAARECCDILAECLSWEEGIHEIRRKFGLDTETTRE
jgi:hypothetical protein